MIKTCQICQAWLHEGLPCSRCAYAQKRVDEAAKDAQIALEAAREANEQALRGARAERDFYRDQLFAKVWTICGAGCGRLVPPREGSPSFCDPCLAMQSRCRQEADLRNENKIASLEKELAGKDLKCEDLEKQLRVSEFMRGWQAKDKSRILNEYQRKVEDLSAKFDAIVKAAVPIVKPRDVFNLKFVTTDQISALGAALPKEALAGEDTMCDKPPPGMWASALSSTLANNVAASEASINPTGAPKGAPVPQLIEVMVFGPTASGKTTVMRELVATLKARFGNAVGVDVPYGPSHDCSSAQQAERLHLLAQKIDEKKLEIKVSERTARAVRR